jgi:uncharacterized protein (DUF2132 family)
MRNRTPPNVTNKPPSQDPLHGITLETIITRLVEKYGWEELGRRFNFKCFNSDPSIASSLKFLRKTPWARQKIEVLYLRSKWPTND